MKKDSTNFLKRTSRNEVFTTLLLKKEKNFSATINVKYHRKYELPRKVKSTERKPFRNGKKKGLAKGPRIPILVQKDTKEQP